VEKKNNPWLRKKSWEIWMNFLSRKKMNPLLRKKSWKIWMVLVLKEKNYTH
jgi:hypothetical protein